MNIFVISSSLGLISGMLYFFLISCMIGKRSGFEGNNELNNFDSFITFHL